jgi:adenosylcobalamin-dependent ribonucleoside-triphosphate reductase
MNLTDIREISADAVHPTHLNSPHDFFVRPLAKGMGEAVANRTILRQDLKETWGDVAERVALGNSLLDPRGPEAQERERVLLRDHIANASLLMSWRHLQHGDADQPNRGMEVFTNCATAPTSFALFYLLLNGSGVGRAYDDDLMLVDWDFAPIVRCVLSDSHPDFRWGTDESVREAKRKYPGAVWFEIPDSREGWAQAVEKIEVMAYSKKYANRVLVLDWSAVRGKNAPIGGMQGRPSSGPCPTMDAIKLAASVKNSGMEPWEQTMWVDHYLAECVLVGGARRAARIATKRWTDPGIFRFIDIKKPEVYQDAFSNDQKYTPLWSANNSVGVDDLFWERVEQKGSHAHKVFLAVTYGAYEHRTGEPGFVDQQKLVQKDLGFSGYQDGEYAQSSRYQPSKHAKKLLGRLAEVVKAKPFTQIVNPCGEVSILVLGGFCVIGDVVPYFARDLDHAEEAFRICARALIRTNLMESLYDREVKRTNRIGVGMTGVQEFAWKHFGFTFRDLIDEEKSKSFWMTLSRFKRAVVDECARYSVELGVIIPHTNSTVKPAGSTSKLFGLTEGWHLPSMREFLRWVQFRSDSPQIQEFRDKGFPIRELRTYAGTTIVGFPTQPEICRIMPNELIVTATEATPEEQYRWIKLGEKYWIRGVDDQGVALEEDTGNQISYTLKYDPAAITLADFRELLIKQQSQVRCCSVMPISDTSAYEYTPEQATSRTEFSRILSAIKDEGVKEDISLESLMCAGGACPL